MSGLLGQLETVMDRGIECVKIPLPAANLGEKNWLPLSYSRSIGMTPSTHDLSLPLPNPLPNARAHTRMSPTNSCTLRIAA